MEKYHKIQSVYKRDPATNYKTFLEGKFSMPEFEFLRNAEWVGTEKVDGTNIRIQFYHEQPYEDVPRGIQFQGKSDRAVLPGPLTQWLKDREGVLEARIRAMFQQNICLYGEGYGGKIQKGGSTYGPEQRFVLFDIKIGDQWLKRDTVERVAEGLGLDLVPIVYRGTLLEIVETVKHGLKSTWGNFNAEGLVARPALELLSFRGERLITKVKERDFPEL